MGDDLTEQQIRDADPEQIDEWIALRRDRWLGHGERFTHWKTWIWHDHPSKHDYPRGISQRELLEQSPDETGEAYPQPYSSQWWAAGPLVDDLERAGLTPVVECRDWERGSFWIAEVEAETVRFLPEGDTAPEAIARAWLLAHVRGLLDDAT